MAFESLPNEILHDILEFFDIVEIFRAFHDLNGRFNSLLLTYFHAYRVNFHFVLKYQSDFAPQHYLPLIVNQIISLRLSDDKDENLPQTEFFFSSGLKLNQFTHLRSLSLCYIDNEETLSKLIVDCHQLPHLTHLKVVQCHRKCTSSVEFSNIIWGLPKLTHFCLYKQGNFCMPTMVSLSIEYLSISCYYWGLGETALLFQQTPNLRQKTLRLYRDHMFLTDLDVNPIVKLYYFPSITVLKLSNVESLKVMKIILLAMPNLTHLKVNMNNINCDGYIWEQIIDGHLSKLKVFHLKMCIEFSDEMRKEQYVDKLVDSFRTRFWLEKHQWYIRCHYSLKNNGRSIIIYTLPYAFCDFNVDMLTMPWKSTCPQDNDYCSYDKVNNLHYKSPLFTDYFSLIQFPNVRNLHINLPFNEYFWQIIPTLHQLNSLTVLSAKENAQLDLQSILDRAPYLYSLTIKSWTTSQISVVQNSNLSVGRLDIREYRGWGVSSYFSIEECKTFIHSPLAMQCEELLIKVENRESILDLMNNMGNIRILHIDYGGSLDISSHSQLYRSIRYQLDKPLLPRGDYNERPGDVFIRWLEDQFPAGCIKARFEGSSWGDCKIRISLEKPFRNYCRIHIY